MQGEYALDRLARFAPERFVVLFAGVPRIVGVPVSISVRRAYGVDARK
jgi:hypothetical protein